ncbi:MTH938/NDUFAF3 family protein [Pseudomonadota bacterium]|nr:MTH938/NDUFAF3 family protein [Pseudomonadota bacterium]
MDINLETHSGMNEIVSYGDNEVVIRTSNNIELAYNQPLILSPTDLITNEMTSIDNDEDITFLRGLKPEVLIFTNIAASHFPPEIRTKFETDGIGVELMSLGAACRTYNLLVSEGRKVVLSICF